MLNQKEILSTIAMIDQQHLDIRTITLGINLRGCVDADVDKLASKVYDRMTSTAEKLVPTAEQLEREFGIPIVNKRVSVTPISLVGAGTGAQSGAQSYVPYAKALDRAAHETGVNFIGGFSALAHKGFTKSDLRLINSIPAALTQTELVCSSVNLASTRAGINMDAVALMGRIIKQTADIDPMGCAKLVVFSNAVEDNPFMAGAFHGAGEPDRHALEGRVQRPQEPARADLGAEQAQLVLPGGRQLDIVHAHDLKALGVDDLAVHKVAGEQHLVGLQVAEADVVGVHRQRDAVVVEGVDVLAPRDHERHAPGPLEGQARDARKDLASGNGQVGYGAESLALGVDHGLADHLRKIEHACSSVR